MQAIQMYHGSKADVPNAAVHLPLLSTINNILLKFDKFLLTFISNNATVSLQNDISQTTERKD